MVKGKRAREKEEEWWGNEGERERERGDERTQKIIIGVTFP